MRLTPSIPEIADLISLISFLSLMDIPKLRGTDLVGAISTEKDADSSGTQPHSCTVQCLVLVGV